MKTPKKDTKVSVEQSSDNVFADLRLDSPQQRLAKAELAHRICEVIQARELTQSKAAELMGIDQPKVSALVRGRLQGFSIERLIHCLNDLGQEVEISIRPTRPARRRGTLRVVAAT